MSTKQQHALERAVRNCLEQITAEEGTSPFTEEVLTKVVCACMKTYQTKLNVGMQDSLADLLDTFRQKVAAEVFETSRHWKVRAWEPTLFPPGCRFYCTRGNSTVVLIEQPPQVRPLRFAAGMEGETFVVYQGDTRLALALPYIYFLLHFRKTANAQDAFVALYSHWRTSPLSSIDDQVCRCLLPNIHQNGNVCLGRGVNLNGTINDVCSSVISSYWGSQFNNDLSTNWWQKIRANLRLKSGTEWQEQSERDPTFILHSQLEPQGTIRHLMGAMTQHEVEPDESSLRHRLNETVDRCVEGLFRKALRYMKKTKFDRYFPKDVTTQLTEALKETTEEMREVLLALDHEIAKLSREVSDGKKQVVKKRSPYWES